MTDDRKYMVEDYENSDIGRDPRFAPGAGIIVLVLMAVCVWIVIAIIAPVLAAALIGIAAILSMMVAIFFAVTK